jgi:hypothetical protein
VAKDLEIAAMKKDLSQMKAMEERWGPPLFFTSFVPLVLGAASHRNTRWSFPVVPRAGFSRR